VRKLTRGLSVVNLSVGYCNGTRDKVVTETLLAPAIKVS
jgi:hypothetical protein